MATARSVLNSFISLFLLLFHLGCFFFPTKSPPTKKRRISPSLSSYSSSSSSRAKSQKAFSLFNPWPYLKPVFSFKYPKILKRTEDLMPPLPPLSTVRSSQASTPTHNTAGSTPTRKRRSGSFSESDFSLDTQLKRSSFTFRSDIFPCTTCGEIFQKTQNLEYHQSTKHAVTELLDGDSAKNVVRIIFKTGWNSKDGSFPNVQRILKIHNSAKILSRFEEYRESIKMKAARGGGRWSERCMADGNELLRFQCSTFICSLGERGSSSGICGGEFCSVCGIIRCGFSPKLDGISTMSTSRGAHLAVPEDMEEEFGFMNVKRAMLVCRVVAGRVAREEGMAVVEDKEDGGFDSVVVRHGGAHGCDGGPDVDELLVFNPRAVLPCFVIIYTV